MTKLARMRYPAEALAMLKEDDPETRVTLPFIQRLLKSGKVPYIKVGRCRMLNYDKLLEYLQNPDNWDERTLTFGGIRPIKE